MIGYSRSTTNVWPTRTVGIRNMHGCWEKVQATYRPGVPAHTVMVPCWDMDDDGAEYPEEIPAKPAGYVAVFRGVPGVYDRWAVWSWDGLRMVKWVIGEPVNVGPSDTLTVIVEGTDS